MASKLSFIVHKAFRDSTGKLYVIFEGNREDPIISAVERSGKYELSKAELFGGAGIGEKAYLTAYEQVPDAVLTLEFTVNLESGAYLLTVKIPNSTQALLETYDVLIQNKSLIQDGANNTISISSSLYYSKAKYDTLYIFPSSSTNYLDTSSKEDYYYTTDGSTAFIGSNDLQNKFLNEIDYSVKGYSSIQLGRFQGGDNNKSITYTCASEVKTTKCPTVYGGTNMLSSSVLDKNELWVCTDPASSNYYLTGCEGENWPCVPTGSSLANDCDGVALQDTWINDYIIQNGNCCASCDGYEVSVKLNSASDIYTADGSITIQITKGTGPYPYTITATSLEGVPNSSYASSGLLSATSADAYFSVGSLYAGTYILKVEDDDDCINQFKFIVPATFVGFDEGWGCGPSGSTSAINYDSGIATAYETDSLCVYCNATSGLLESGADAGGKLQSSILGEWLSPIGTISAATTNVVTGAALTDGMITITPSTPAPYQIIGYVASDWNVFDINSWFANSPDASPYEFKLYKISASLNYGVQEEGDGVEATIIAHAGTSVITTTTASILGTVQFSGLAYGRYVVIASYTNGDATKEYEECYALREFSVGLQGCNEPSAANYNAAVTIPDGSCITPACSPSLFKTPFALAYDEPSCGFKIKIDNWLINNSEVHNAYYGGYDALGTASSSYEGPLEEWQAGMAYILENIFCGPMPWHTPNSEWDASMPLGMETSTLSNSVTIPFVEGVPDSLGLKYIVPTFIISFADGVSHTITTTEADYIAQGGMPIYSLHYLLFNPLITHELPLFGCDYILEHGGIDHIKTIIYYGTPGVWDELFESTWYNAGVDFVDTMAQCQLGQLLNPGCLDAVQGIYGCTDSLATNYDFNATTDDGSCEYPDPDDIPGCIDPEASNYNANANLDDGSCEYISVETSGCTDPAAANYDPTATVMNYGSCIYDGSGGDDCTALHDFVTSNVGWIEVAANSTITNTASTLNSITTICDSDSTGSIVINFPDISGVTIYSSTGVYIGVMLQQLNAPVDLYPSGTAVQGSWDLGWVDGLAFVTQWFFDETTINATSFLDADTTSSYTFSDLDNGQYTVTLLYTPNALSDASGNVTINAPGWSVASQNGGVLNAFCSHLQGIVAVGIDVCTGSTDVYGCTDPAANNYNSLATVDDGLCTYICNPCVGECICPNGTYSVDCCTPNPISGCTDPNAVNYNAIATMEDGSCSYPSCAGSCSDFVSTHCIPNYLGTQLRDIQTCIANSGNSFYTKLITGLADDCSTMDAWKMIIISEILNHKGLPCVFNCSDSATPDSAGVSCDEAWTSGGSLYWNTANSSNYQMGTIIKHNDILYQAMSTTGLNLDPSTTVSFPENTISGWQPCINAVTFSDSTNYLEKFLSFAQSYCKDCDIPSYITKEAQATKISNLFTVGGTSIENDGSAYSDEGGD